jgi:HK97 gp10 family phage protein
MSDGVRVEVKGAQELGRTLNDAADSLLDMTPANTAAGLQVARSAAARAPRRTGRLRGSLRPLRIDRAGVQVGSSAPYAAYQEYGTRHVRAHYFLTGALSELTTDPYADYVDKTLQKVRGA